MGHFTTVLAYLGPETMLPMTSIIAGAAGVLMMFGRNSLRWCSAMFRGLASERRGNPMPANLSRKIGNGPVGRVRARAMGPEQVPVD